MVLRLHGCRDFRLHFSKVVSLNANRPKTHAARRTDGLNTGRSVRDLARVAPAVIHANLNDSTVRVAIYETGDRTARFTVKNSAADARELLAALGFKLVYRFAHREYWKSVGGLRALIAAG